MPTLLHARRSAAFCTALLLTLGATRPPLVSAGPQTDSAAPGGAQERRADQPDVDSLLESLREASEHTRPAVARKLILLGEAGLATTRAARDREQNPRLRRVLTTIATWQLAGKIAPTLRERSGTGLRFDGQYADLSEEGPEVVNALLALLGGEARFPGDDALTQGNLREASARALADVGSPSLLPELRTMYHDPLFFRPLAEQIGILMAIFGDTYAVEQEISRLEELIAQDEALSTGFLLRNMDLSELYYQIRDYSKAVACYDRILLVYEQQYRIAKRSRLPPNVLKNIEKEFALHYYNAACSQTLNGDLEKAKEFLKKCIQLDASHFENLARDGDLAKLRESEGYREFRAELSKLRPRESF